MVVADLFEHRILVLGELIRKRLFLAPLAVAEPEADALLLPPRMEITMLQRFVFSDSLETIVYQKASGEMLL